MTEYYNLRIISLEISGHTFLLYLAFLHRSHILIFILSSTEIKNKLLNILLLCLRTCIPLRRIPMFYQISMSDHGVETRAKTGDHHFLTTTGIDVPRVRQYFFLFIIYFSYPFFPLLTI